ncbi:hypothetical protein [Portibacter lacus]|uniref:Curli production assembly/transport component CsgE n=1 Tax=Portibacter lacus TaxID=1099794 RepID=A0AA37SS38_9BACT|nr:hypothetical protein [Portibacter lacus]GLR18775.1 hypothetical protein GCM10007940_33910 [Portibacter lacus]
MIKQLLLLVTILCYSSNINAQSRIAIYETDIIDAKQKQLITLSIFEGSSTEEDIQKIPEYLISSYSQDDRFIVIDKKNEQLIKDEKERQKSEDFIDGYIVQQGKLEGAEFLLRSFVTNKGKELAIRIYDVENSQILCESSTPFRNVKNAVESLVSDLNSKCFELYIDVVRVEEEKKGKAKSILILGGNSQNLTNRATVEIFTKVTEEINGRKIERNLPVGKGVISQVQDENFSLVKVLDGGEEIKNRLDQGQKLFCKIK